MIIESYRQLGLALGPLFALSGHSNQSVIRISASGLTPTAGKKRQRASGHTLPALELARRCPMEP